MSPIFSIGYKSRLLTGLVRASFVLFILSGCTTLQPDKNIFDGSSNSLELTDTPFFPQQEYHCGPAALATVLGASTVRVQPDDLVNKIYLPKRKGSLQIELLAATRRYGRIPYPLESNPAHIIDELNAGRPVLVLQNLGLKVRPFWHYVVVIGYDANKNNFILRSGTKERLEMNTRKFLRTWNRAGAWSFVALKPDEIPVHANQEKYLEAIVAMERLNDPALLIDAYNQLLKRWPENKVARFGLGNAYYADGQYEAAAPMYAHLLGLNPEHIPTRNNLALTMGKLNCFDSALKQIDKVLELAKENNKYLEDTQSTRTEILQLKNQTTTGTLANPQCRKLDNQLIAN